MYVRSLVSVIDYDCNIYRLYFEGLSLKLGPYPALMPLLRLRVGAPKLWNDFSTIKKKPPFVSAFVPSIHKEFKWYLVRIHLQKSGYYEALDQPWNTYTACICSLKFGHSANPIQ